MKKVLISLMTATLLLSACSNDEKMDDTHEKVGSFTFQVAFEDAGSGEKAGATSTAIPTTSWENIKQVQMFLYEKLTGKVAFSYEIRPTGGDGNNVFTWTNIPTGSYDLALVANVKSNTDNVQTYVNGTTPEQFTDFNVRNRILNTDIFMTLKPKNLPSGHVWGADRVGYAESSEIFTAYREDVTISASTPAVLGTLALLREVSLMRVRVNKKASFLNETGKIVNFADASSFIVIHRMPEKFGMKTLYTDSVSYGGVFANSNEKHIMVAATGTGTFKTANPTTGYKSPTTIIDSDFTLWRDIIVLPNISKIGTPPTLSATAADNRKYFVVISAMAPAGYILDNGTELATATKIYWSGLIDEVFTPNVIREVNLTIRSRGSIVNPEKPTSEGGLTITVGSPEEWNSAIQVSNEEI